jgi:hypothetical protein
MDALTDFLTVHPGGYVDASGISVDDAANKSMLCIASVRFLKFFLRLKQPKKVLEIGVAEGGGTIHILDELSPDAVLYSVDLLTQRKDGNNETVPVGHYAAAYYDPKRHARWRTYFGFDPSECIEEIGNGIDCVILDTVHRLPGEVLSFLSILPFIEDNCLLLLDDISLHSRDIFMRKGNNSQQFSNFVLFSAIFSTRKFLCEDMLPNFGAVIIDKDLCMRHIDFLMNCLFMPWSYTPDIKIIYGTYTIIKKYYHTKILDMYISSCRIFCDDKHLVFYSIDLKEKIGKLKNKSVYYFGIGEAYTFYKSMFRDVYPVVALLSMIPDSGVPDEIDGIPVRMIDDVLADNTDILPIIIFARTQHIETMKSFLESHYPEWGGDNVLSCIY